MWFHAQLAQKILNGIYYLHMYMYRLFFMISIKTFPKNWDSKYVKFHWHFGVWENSVYYFWDLLAFSLDHSSPRRLAGEKKFASYNHKTTIWVPHEYYLNPELKKISSRAFWVIAILRFSPYVARVDFKGLISK